MCLAPDKLNTHSTILDTARVVAKIRRLDTDVGKCIHGRWAALTGHRTVIQNTVSATFNTQTTILDQLNISRKYRINTQY